MSQDIRGSLLFDDESELGDDVSGWEDEHEFGLTDTDLHVMSSIGWTPEDLTIEEDQRRYPQYLTKKR